MTKLIKGMVGNFAGQDEVEGTVIVMIILRQYIVI